MTESQANLNVRREDGAIIVEFQDRKILEELTINHIGEELGELADSGPNPKMLLDFKNVEHLSERRPGHAHHAQ